MAKNKTEETVTTALTVEAPAPLATADESFDLFADDVDKRSADELVTERYRIVQALTKAKQKNDSLRDGQLYGNVSLKGLDRALIVPLYDYRTIVERKGENAGQKEKGGFVKEYSETAFDSRDFRDARINGYVKKCANVVKELHKTETDNGNTIGLVYNCYVAFLDETDGLSVKGFGLLQADKINIRPYLSWRQDRVAFNGATKYPTFSFRTFVDGKSKYTNPNNETTQQFTFRPFADNNWKESVLEPTNPTHRELLLKLKEHKALVTSGAIKVAEYSDADDSEEAQEQAAF